MLLWTDSTWRSCGVPASGGVLAALSGGADSVALLLELIRLQKDGLVARVEAAHLHHGIRGTDADADAAFVSALCERLNVPLAAERIDVPALAKESGTSLELAARNARYAFLERVRADRDLDCVATGHHRDDQAETLLLHLLRGSGTDGLSGMRVRSGRLIRPLLFTDKAAILAYLNEAGQSFCTDTTNFETGATRNRVRLEVMPVLEAINPAAKKALSEAAAHVAEDADFLNALADEAFITCGTDRKKLSTLERPVRIRVLKRLLPYADYTRADLDRLDALLSGQTGDCATLKNGVVAWLDATDLRIGLPKNEPYCFRLPDSGSVKLPTGTLTVERVERASVPCGGSDAYVEEAAVEGTVTVRTPREGDRFTPFGMTGSKLLSDFFTDRKVPRFSRNVPLICDGRGIVFVAGHTVDERMRLSADPKRIIHYHYEED